MLLCQAADHAFWANEPRSISRHSAYDNGPDEETNGFNIISPADFKTLSEK